MKYAIRWNITNQFMYRNGDDVLDINPYANMFVIRWFITATKDEDIPITKRNVGDYNGRVFHAHVQSDVMVMPRDWYQVDLFAEQLDKLLEENRIEFTPLADAPPTQYIKFKWTPTVEVS